MLDRFFRKTKVKHRSWSIKLTIIQLISLILVMLPSILLLRRYLQTSNLKLLMLLSDEFSTSWQINATLVRLRYLDKK